MSAAPSILWFRRDLRLADHEALTAAAAGGAVVPLFVLDPTFLERSGAPRLAFLFRSLRALNASMGGALVVRRGKPAEVIAALAAEVDANTVWATADYAPYGRARDAEVAAALQAAGVALRFAGSNYAVPPGSVAKADGSPYAVFTPFSKVWRQIGWSAPLPVPKVAWRGAPELGREPIPADPPTSAELPEAGEAAAWRQWERFAASALAEYKERRNEPGIEGTSKLSPYLRFGAVHPRSLLAELNDSPSHAHYASELCWREFYADVLFHQPRTAWENLQPKMKAMVVDTDAAARERFEVWCRGETGYPIVDAGMRELLVTGWMHNRVRMIAASFLVKDLHLPWQWGARHFMRHLVDGDLASNNHGWQWTAGTGTDAAPYFRIFNPVAQGEKFDPSGDYVRRFIPELADVSADSIHQPWTLGVLNPYVAPMVDHATERAEALARYERVKGS